MDVILYTTHCPKCKVLTTKLQLAGIPYTECDDVDRMIELGFQSAPVLSVNGQTMDFIAAVQWIGERGKI